MANPGGDLERWPVVTLGRSLRHSRSTSHRRTQERFDDRMAPLAPPPGARTGMLGGMSSWQARLVDLIVRRFSDSQALMTEMRLRFDREFVSELPSAASLKVLAAAVVFNCEARQSVDLLLSALQAESGASEPELDEISRDYVVEAEDPRLWAAIDAHREEARRIARRPRLDALVQTLMDVPSLDIEQVFVAPNIRVSASPVESMQSTERTEPGKPGPAAARPFLEVWPERSAWLLVLGGPGAGKSMLARWLTLQPAAGHNDVPVRIELQQYAKWQADAKNAASGFFAFLEVVHAGQGAALSGRQIRTLALAGRVLWLIDGLDEITDPDARLECARRIANLRRHGGRAVITSRPLGLNLEIALLRDAGVETCTLESFAAPQLHELGLRWQLAGLIEDEALRRFEVQLAASQQLRELARSPLISTFMLILARRDDLPRQRCRLLAEICALVVGRWAEQRRPGGYQLDLGRRMAFLRGLAWAMRTELEQGLGNIVDRRHLVRFAARFFQQEAGATRDEAEVRARLLVDELGVQIHVLAWFGGNSFGFSHRSFLEFFAADMLVHRDTDTVMAYFAEKWSQGAWAEVLAMAAGLLAERQPQLVVRALRGVFSGIEPFDAPRLLSASEFVVRCLAEVEALDSPAVRRLCEVLTELWIAMGPIAGLDIRPLARALRTIGPRWPGATILLEWLRSTRGRGPISGIQEFSTSFSGGSVGQLQTVRLAVAVATPEQRPELLELLADPSSFLDMFAEDLELIGPWTEAERSLLEATLLRHGEDWDHQVLEWLGDLRGRRIEQDLLDAQQRRGPPRWEGRRRAVLLLRSSAHWRQAVDQLDRLLMDGEWALLSYEFPTRLARVLERMEVGRSEAICRALTRARAPELQAAAHLVLAEGGDDDAAAKLVAMLRDPGARNSDAANWALAHGRFADAHQRVMDHLNDEVALVTLVWAVSACAHIADERGPSERARAWWLHLADDGEWSPSLRWVAIGALLRRGAWRELGMARLRLQQIELYGNSPNIDHALRILADQADGRDVLDGLMRDDPDPHRRRWIAQVLLERFPGHPRARAELREQAAGSTQRDEQHSLSHVMRRLGLPRLDWEDVARKLITHVEDPISRCASATLLADRPAMEALLREDPTWPVGLTEHLRTLLRCEDLRLSIVQDAVLSHPQP